MKRTILSLALFAVVGFASAQSSNQTSHNDNTAAASNTGVTTNVVSYGADNIRQTLDTDQAHSAASSFATSAVWRCSTSGWGAAAQGVGAGISIAGKGGTSEVCEAEFREGLNQSIDRVLANKDVTPAQRATILAIACKDEVLADAFEHDPAKQCPDMLDAKEKREARWAKARPTTKPLPKPWTAGG